MKKKKNPDPAGQKPTEPGSSSLVVYSRSLVHSLMVTGHTGRDATKKSAKEVLLLAVNILTILTCNCFLGMGII